MIIIKTIKELKNIIRSNKKQGHSIGFVPTMGFLHEGHLSLIRAAKKENDLVVVSIFVNPTQFGVGEDFEAYPRDLDNDAKVSEAAGADVIFNPSINEMYPEKYQTYVEVLEITNKLCGLSRPTHFKGVTTVVNKLFNIVEPDRAYFGQKDAQQVAVLQKMVLDLNMNIDIIPCPIVREADGLAMSSRNTYLSPEQRNAALILSKSLFTAKDMINKGGREAAEIKETIIKMINSEPLAAIDYVEIVDALSLNDIPTLKGSILIALAVKIGKTRLIDNIRAEV
ncbi:MAG: pantoate--beta-alanine ligase [Clostridia bacterium]|jgi:pantoate--beta-alanine ligase|nr:pantoate--beta-alanine ligase [Clostridia bacterium]